MNTICSTASPGIRSRLMYAAALLCTLWLGQSVARAEGENWVPLYNKLARMLNERTLAAGAVGTITPGPGETLEAAHRSYVNTDGTVTPDTVITQGHLQTLRARILALAHASFVVPDTDYEGQASIPMLAEYVVDADNHHVPDANGNDTLKTPSLFTLASLPNANAFTRIPPTYGTPSYSNTFVDVPVFWEHFDELYKTLSLMTWTKAGGNWQFTNVATHLTAGLPTTTLVLGMDAGTTDPILVESTAGFATSGVLLIGAVGAHEHIGYTGITPYSFTGITRGLGGSWQEMHTEGMPVIALTDLLVLDTSAFPATGTLVLPHGEFVNYAGKTATSFHVTERSVVPGSPSVAPVPAGGLVRKCEQNDWRVVDATIAMAPTWGDAVANYYSLMGSWSAGNIYGFSPCVEGPPQKGTSVLALGWMGDLPWYSASGGTTYSYYSARVPTALFPVDIDYYSFAAVWPPGETPPPWVEYDDYGNAGILQNQWHRWHATLGALYPEDYSTALGDTTLATPLIPATDVPVIPPGEWSAVFTRGYTVMGVAALQKWTFTAWASVFPTSIVTTVFKPPTDSNHDALVAQCEACATNTCAVTVNTAAPAGAVLPGLEMYLGTSSPWYGPALHLYISQGNTTLPHTHRALGGTTDEGILQTFSLDTRVVDEGAGFLSLLRPTGRIVTFNTATGKPVGPDSGATYYMQSIPNGFDLVFPARLAQDTIIHRYTGGQLTGVSIGIPFETADHSTGVPGDWTLRSALTWGPVDGVLQYIVTPRYDIVVTGNPVTMLRFRARQTLADLIRLRLLYGSPHYTAVTKEIFSDGDWSPIDSVSLTPQHNAQTGEIEKWQIDRRGGAREQTETSTDPETGLRTETEKYKVDDETDAVRNARVYQAFPWGDEVVSETEYDPGEDPPAGMKPSSYAYYTDPENDGTGYGKLKQSVSSSGSWQRYSYDSAGRVSKTVSGFANAPVTADENQARVTTYLYTPLAGSGDDGSLAPDSPRTVVDTTLGVETRRSYTVVRAGETLSIQAATPGAAWNAAGNLVTTTRVYTSGDFKGKTKSVSQPDGTITLYSYLADENAGTLTTTVDSGVPSADGTAIVDGTRSISVEDAAGRSLASYSVDIVSNAMLSETINSDFDSFGRPQRTDYMDGTFTTTTYSCCGVDTTTDRDGVATHYTYDDRRRVQTEERNGIYAIYEYDELDHVIGTTRQGTDQTSMPQGSSTFDTAGRQETTTDAAGNVTTYSYSLDEDGNPLTTTTYPDGSTSIETRFADGSSRASLGTAVHHVRHETGVDVATGLQYSLEVTLDAEGNDTAEWTKSYSDMLGHTVRTEQPLPGGLLAVSTTEYNSLSQMVKQVDPDGVTTLFTYNAKGEQEYNCVDMNGNGVMDFDGTDRITRSVSEIGAATIPGATGTVRRTKQYAWQQAGENTPTLVSVSESSLDGLQSWTSSFGVVSSSVTEIDAQTATRTQTSIAADGTKTISTTVNGQSASSIRYDADDVEIGRVTFGYDAHGRQNTVTDSRTGTTSTVFDNADHAVSVTTPDPDGAGPQLPQTTSTEYNERGQVSKVTQPDGGEVFSIYWPTGEPKRTWGSRTYPVEYSYDDQGRMKTLTTWQDFAGDSGRAVTTWNYEPATGRLQQKLYDDGKGPSYSYSPAGRLLARTWARKVNGQDLVTTYTYTAAGDLETVDYSNTPGPLKDVVYGFDRQGRQISITDSTGTRATTFTDAGQPDAVTWQDGLLAGMALDYTQDNLLRPAGYTLTRDAQPQPEMVTAASYGYDAAGRLHTVTAGTDVFTYAYLPNSGPVDTVTARHGATEIMKTVKTWDNLNRLTSIENRNGADLPVRVYSSHVYTYNSANQRTEALREDATKWAYGYDALGQVTSGVKKKQDDTPLPGLSFGYLFDDIGNRREATTSVGGALRAATYSANLLNQYSQRTVPGFIDLLGEAAPDATVTVNNQPTVRDGALFFKSLPVNNTASAVSQDVHVVGVKNDVGPLGEDAVTEVQGKRFVPQTPEGFTYDDDGNLTSDGRWSYEWDAENRLVAMETLAGLPASIARQRLEFAYDSQSRRVAKKVFAWDVPTSSFILHNSSLFLYDAWNLIADFSVDVPSQISNLKSSFVWGLDLSGSLQGAGGVGGLLASTSASTGTTQYFCFDGNGNVVALVDAATGDDAGRYEYDPFGNVVLQTGTAAGANVFRFSTKYQDDETGLVYYGFRYYAPGIGRWASRDPMGERASANLHCVVQNRTISHSDRLGLYAITDGDTVGVKNCGVLVLATHNINTFVYRYDNAECRRAAIVTCNSAAFVPDTARIYDWEVISMRLSSGFVGDVEGAGVNAGFGEHTAGFIAYMQYVLNTARTAAEGLCPDDIFLNDTRVTDPSTNKTCDACTVYRRNASQRYSDWLAYDPTKYRCCPCKDITLVMRSPMPGDNATMGAIMASGPWMHSIGAAPGSKATYSCRNHRWTGTAGLYRNYTVVMPPEPPPPSP